MSIRRNSPRPIHLSYCLLTLVVLVAAVLLGFASTGYAKLPSLAKYESQHYTIYTNLTRKEAQKYGRHMDLVFAEYARKFSAFRDRRRGRMNFYLFRTQQQYLEQLAKFGINASGSGGMFFGTPKAHGLATWVEGVPEEYALHTLQHEGFHQFAHNYIGPRLPLWVNEGLAEYFGDGLLIQGKMKIGIASERRIASVQTAIQNHTTLAFDDLLTITSQQWFANMQNESAKGLVQYDQSWSVVYFLIHGDRGKYQHAFEQYLMLLSEGRTSDKAFHTAFGSDDTQAFYQRWRQFVLHLEPDTYSTAIQRLQFLARGLKTLHEHAMPMPATLDQLRQTLQQVQFHTMRTTHAGQFTISAMDESNYKYESKTGAAVPFEMLEPSADNLPPRLAAPGLRPQPMLVWSRNDQQELVPAVTYR